MDKEKQHRGGNASDAKATTAMRERLSPPPAGLYKVEASHACTNKILGEFKAGEVKELRLSGAHVAEFAGPHQPFKLTTVKE